MTHAELLAADALLTHQLDLLRLTAHAQREALELLDALGRELEAQLRRHDLTAFNRERLTRLLSQATETIDRYYASVTASAAQNAGGVASGAANVAASATTTAAASVDAALPTTTFMRSLLSKALIEGAVSGEWWKKQAKDTAFRFSAAVRRGVLAGETNEQIVRRVTGTVTQPGVMTVAKNNARALVHASIQSVAAAARRETYQRNRDIIKGIRQVSTFDSHTTEICIAYSGATWDLDYNPILGNRLPYNGGVPRHWGCRSVEVPIMKTFRELGIKAPEIPEGMRASVEGPIAARTTMKQFLDRQGAAFQDRVLGKGRAQLYRSGKITLQQLLDLRGNPLTLKQLRAKYG